jgi:hypothetical protein
LRPAATPKRRFGIESSAPDVISSYIRRKIDVLARFSPFFALTRRGETSLVARHGFGP